MDQNNEMKDLETLETVNEEPTVQATPNDIPQASEPVQTPVQPTPQPQPVVQSTVTFASNTINIPDEYKPISMWGYFGYELLFSIPCIGFIILLVFAFGGNKNINVRNFARSYFCYIIIAIVLALIILGVMALFGLSLNYK